MLEIAPSQIVKSCLYWNTLHLQETSFQFFNDNFKALQIISDFMWKVIYVVVV